MKKDNSVEIFLYVLGGISIALAVVAFLSIWFELW
jgi:hypothetical protein